MPPKPGDPVEHPEFGPGILRQILGSIAVVEFYGEDLEVQTNDLRLLRSEPVPLEPERRTRDGVHFRQSFEALNLGVVPPYPEELISLTINGEEVSKTIAEWFVSARTKGLCKVVFGDYGSGKSHYLRLVEASALKAGWVVASIEFDPKEADPAKPFLVYRALMSNLRFPKREDGTVSRRFMDLVNEIRPRDRWANVSSGTYFRMSPWYRSTVHMLRHYQPEDTGRYLDACNWLGGCPVPQSVVRSMCREAGCKEYPPAMPRMRECADIYVFHLVVLDEICRALRYKGLLLILDEAEHVRGYNVQRKDRANNFFDLLARCAHLPLHDETAPIPNDHNHDLPPFWKAGPHFGLVVGLTEGNIFSDPSLSLRDACVFLHDKRDIVRLKKPTAHEYEEWCKRLLERFHQHAPEATLLLAEGVTREKLARVLVDEFKKSTGGEITLRLWIKLAALVPSMILAGATMKVEELQAKLQVAAQQASGRHLPWESYGA